MRKLSTILSIAAILVLAVAHDAQAGHRWHRGGCGGCYGGGYGAVVYSGGCYGGGYGAVSSCGGGRYGYWSDTCGGGGYGGTYGGTCCGGGAYGAPSGPNGYGSIIRTPSSSGYGSGIRTESSYVSTGRRESSLPYDGSRFTQPRAWVYDASGTKVVLGDLKGFTRGEVYIEKYNRSVVSIPFEQLSRNDQKHVAAEYGQLARTWVDRSGKFEQLARYRGTQNGQVRLETEKGRVLSVGVDKLSRADQTVVRLLSGMPNAGGLASAPTIVRRGRNAGCVGAATAARNALDT